MNSRNSYLPRLVLPGQLSTTRFGHVSCKTCCIQWPRTICKEKAKKCLHLDAFLCFQQRLQVAGVNSKMGSRERFTGQTAAFLPAGHKRRKMEILPWLLLLNLTQFSLRHKRSSAPPIAPILDLCWDADLTLEKSLTWRCSHFTFTYSYSHSQMTLADVALQECVRVASCGLLEFSSNPAHCCFSARLSLQICTAALCQCIFNRHRHSLSAEE